MITNFYNMEGNLLLDGETIEKIYIYGNGEVLGEISEITEHTINKTINSSYDGAARKVYLDTEIKKSTKLNLNRKDNFYMKNPDKRFAIDKAYVLYINANNVYFKCLGDVLALETEHEKYYLLAYELTFKKIEFRRHKIERFPMENPSEYRLKDGEEFSQSCYGSDKNHPCIYSYDYSENIRFLKKHPELKNEKGIIKRYFENETLEEHTLIVTRPIYSKTEKDDYRIELENIAKLINEAGVDISYYGLEKLYKKGFKILLP